MLLACADEQCQIQLKKRSSLAALFYDTECLCGDMVVCQLANQAAVNATIKQY